MSTATQTTFPFRWYISVAFVLFIFALVGIYSSRMAHNTAGYDDDQAAQRYATLAKLRATDQKTLTTADWIDKDKGTVRIPIDEAMVQEVPLLAAKPLTMGTAIPGVGATTMNPLPGTTSPTAIATPPTGATPATKAPPQGNPTAPSSTGQPTK